MRKQRRVRAVAAVLLAGLSLAQLGCVQKPSDVDSSQQLSSETTSRLVIETPPAVYSQAFLADMLPRTADLCGRLVFLGEGLVLGEMQKQELTDFLSERVFPMLLETNVYDTELTQLVEKAELLCDRAEASREDWAFLSLQLYQTMQAVLDAPRAGEIAYRSTLLWIEEKIAICEERYEKYGNEWDLEDAALYRDLHTRVDAEIGQDCYTAMIEMLMLSLNAVSGAFPTEETAEGFGLSDGELLLLMQRQADAFLNQAVTVEQWSLLGEVFSHAVPSPNGHIGREEVNALNKNGYFERALGVMPSFLDLYAQAVKAMTSQQLTTLRGGSADDRAAVMGQVLSLCQPQFLAWSNAVQVHCATATSDEEKIIRKGDLYGEFEVFCEAHPTQSADALWNTILSCIQAADGNASRLRQSAIGFLRGIAPYATFVATHLAEEKGETLC